MLWRSRQQFHTIELCDLSKLERTDEDHSTYSQFAEMLSEQTELKLPSLRAEGASDVGSLQGFTRR